MTSDAAAAPAPRVSIVVPTYNGGRLIGATLDSVESQTFVDWELVVYDDGSTDATYDVLKERTDQRIKVAQGANSGVATARNQGLTLTDPRSAYVIFLDHDDVWKPEALEMLVGLLDAHPEYSATHSLARCIDVDGRPVVGDDLESWMGERQAIRDGRVVPLSADEPTTFAALTYRNWVVTPGTQLIRREVIDRVGGFDAGTTPADDWDMALRVSRAGDIGCVRRPLLLWRRHDGAQSYHSPGYGRAYLRVRVKVLTDPSNTADQRRSARQAFTITARLHLATAVHDLRGRRFRGAARQVGLAVRQYSLYARTEVSMRRRDRRSR